MAFTQRLKMRWQGVDTASRLASLIRKFARVSIREDDRLMWKCHRLGLMRHVGAGAVLLAGMLTASTASADVVVTIDGNLVDAHVTLPVVGVTIFSADVHLEFDNPRNLTAECLGIDAELLDLADILDIVARLPDPGGLQVAAGFPVRITIEPPAGCGLAFDNEVKVDIDTPNLLFIPLSAYRLMKAPIGGQFYDMTSQVLAGSVRARGSSGGFSEFVLVLDLLQDPSADFLTAYNALDAKIQTRPLSATAQNTLAADLALVKAAFDAGNYAAAIVHLSTFETHLRAQGGTGVANEWRSARDLVNDLGDMVSLMGSLRFNLGRLNGET